MVSRRAGWVIVVASVLLVVVFLTLETIVYLRHMIKVSSCLLSSLDDGVETLENSGSDEIDDLPARLARIDSVCKKYAARLCEDPSDQRKSSDHLYCGKQVPSFYLVHTRHLGYCAIPKAATSSLKTFILEAEDAKVPADNADQIFVEFGSRYPPVLPSPDLAKKLDSKYTKLIVVRHPFDRLVSAYVDKIRTTQPFIIAAMEMYKGGFVGTGPNGTFTFAEFVNNILNQPVEKWDEHWAPFTPLCMPCSMRYNVIAKMETLDHDLEAMLPKIGLSGRKFPKTNVKAPNNDTRRQAVAQHLSELSRQQLLQLHAIYMYDFELFGYTLKGYTDPVL